MKLIKMIKKAGELYNDHQIQKAINLCNKYLEQDQSNAHVYLILALCYRHLQNIQEYERLLKIAIQIDPDCEAIYYAMGKDYLMSRNYKAAIQEYKIAINLNYSTEDLYAEMVVAYIGEDDIPNAYYYASEGLRLFPNSPMANYNMAMVLIKFEQELGKSLIDVIQYLDIAYKGGIKAKSALYKGKYYFIIKDYKMAMDCFNEYFLVDKGDTETRWLYIHCLLYTGHFIDAVGFIFTQYDINDAVAVQMVNKYSLEDFRVRVHTYLSKEEEEILLKEIRDRVV